MEILKVPVTDRAEAMSFVNGIAVNALTFNVSEDHQADFILRNEQIKYLDIPLHEFGVSHVTSLRASFRKYGFGYSRGILSVTFHLRVKPDDVTTPSNGGMTAVCQALINCAKFLLLDRRHRLKAM